MDKLPCGISRMKHNNTIEQLRGSKTRENIKVDEKEEERVPYDEMIPGSPKRRRSARKPPAPPSTGAVREQQFNHGEEITHENCRRSDSFSKSASTSQFMMTTASSSTSTTGYHEHDTSSRTSKTAKHAYMNFQGKENTANTQQATAGKHSLAANTKFEQKERETEGLNEQQRRQKNNDNWMGESPTDEVFKNSICLVCKNRRPKIGWKRDFSYKEIHAATEGFSQTKFLSEGGFGSVYRGDLDELAFAVKQHNSASFQGEKEFKSEVEVLSKARHENLVMLLGSCSEGNDRLLVYEYVCNGSLDQHLSNFGLARTQHEDSEPSLETRVVGTLGYLAPEYAEYGKVSTKTDVYAFGVVLSQLITGLKTTDKILGGIARPLLKERNYPDLIDQRILESHDVHQLFWMVRVAEKCLSKDPQKRLTMDKVTLCTQ
ncbi:hypothetical protein POTOM_012712 [Populus tomentosa]|uniref:Protein kinase domain-containing protein n=1 Tax=Populus tomentosa TaxID=118781 RepID=A0A8X8AAY0_POPTO|nr:hypothetical protein POTOM_012712 [Populus tomentosa]